VYFWMASLPVSRSPQYSSEGHLRASKCVWTYICQCSWPGAGSDAWLKVYWGRITKFGRTDICAFFSSVFRMCVWEREREVDWKGNQWEKRKGWWLLKQAE